MSPILRNLDKHKHTYTLSVRTVSSCSREVAYITTDCDPYTSDADSHRLYFGEQERIIASNQRSHAEGSHLIACGMEKGSIYEIKCIGKDTIRSQVDGEEEGEGMG